MITLGIVEARMRRQKIVEIAGRDYLNKIDISPKIPYLSKFLDEQFLFGIYKSPTKWTVLSVNYLHSAYDNEPMSLRLDSHSHKIHDYFARDGHKFKKDVILEDGRKIWMKSAGMSCAFQNMMLMLQSLPYPVKLEN